MNVMIIIKIDLNSARVKFFCIGDRELEMKNCNCLVYHIYKVIEYSTETPRIQWVEKQTHLYLL